MTVSDWASVIGVLVGVTSLIASCVGWFLRMIFSAVKGLKDDVAKLQESLPGVYMRRDEMQKLEDRISSEIRGVAHTLERHMENSTQLWVNSQRDPAPPEKRGD